jgi:ribonucleoside-diphosphate reductase alpha chain
MAKTPQAPITDSSTGQGLSIERNFTTPGQDPFATVEWELRDAHIGHGGKVSFEQNDVEFPK